jgi:hypothetical protein
MKVEPRAAEMESTTAEKTDVPLAARKAGSMAVWSVVLMAPQKVAQLVS